MSKGRLSELARLFLRLGTTAFGGPAAHIAMMHAEVVRRRRWMDEEAFLDLIAATNLIPGPNSTELAVHLGYTRARWRGLVVAGLCFITPAMAIVLAIAWAYVRYGTTPAAEGLLRGIEPVVVVIIALALVSLGRAATKRSAALMLLGLVAFGLYLAGVSELLIVFGAGAGAGLIRALRHWPGSTMLSGAGLLAVPLGAGLVETNAGLGRLFLLFLKFGSVVYGSGYVLFAFLHGDLVERLGWLTEQQLVDALAIGQITPGPVFTSATFIGYTLDGLGGALVATAGIFLPSFVFVAALGPLMDLARRAAWARQVLDAVSVAALGLMAGVLVQLGGRVASDLLSTLLAAAAALAIIRFQVHEAWVILAGGLIGLGLQLL